MAIIKVDLSNLVEHPQCAHGPTLKFTRQVNVRYINFFACSAYRDRKECPFYLLEGQQLSESKKLRWKELQSELSRKYDRFKLKLNLDYISSLPADQRRFCYTCDVLFSQESSEDHSDHRLFNREISDVVLRRPTSILQPLEKDKNEAQYWFTENSVSAIASFLSKLKLKSILCLGTPKVHEKISHFLKSILLDFDPRYHLFYAEDEYLWFNMFNFHFMNGQRDLTTLKNIFSCGTCAVVVDPPFGARLEGLAFSLNKLKEMNSSFESNQPLVIMLILPYFMEAEVEKLNLGLKKLDFSIEYINHRFSKNKTPVCIFTNADQSQFPAGEFDCCKYCEMCGKVVRYNAVHCTLCNVCHRPDYKRCGICLKCVKPSYRHCKACKICVNENHVCSLKSLILKRPMRSKRKKIKCN